MSSSDKEKEFSVSLGDDIISLVTMKKADGKNATIFRLLNNSGDWVGSGTITNENDYIKNVEIGSSIVLGNYYGKDIEWRVLKISEDLKIFQRWILLR